MGEQQHPWMNREHATREVARRCVHAEGHHLHCCATLHTGQTEESPFCMRGQTEPYSYDCALIYHSTVFWHVIFLDPGTRKPESEEVFTDEEDAPKSLEPETKADSSGLNDVEEISKYEVPVKEDPATPDEIIHVIAVGKGLSGALDLL